MQNSPPGPAPAASRLHVVDALRGLCALVVFLTHWHLWSSLPPQGALEHAIRNVVESISHTVTVLTWPTGGHHPAVIGFFVLSGFCIHYPFARQAAAGAATPDWKSYFRRRFLRIMPVYWVAGALGLLFVAAETLRPTGHPLLQLHASGSLTDVFVRLGALNCVYPDEIYAGNYILITVATEIVMYALYPAIHRCATRGQWRLLALLALSFHIGAAALLPFVSPFWIFNSIFMLGLFWFAGAWAAHLFVNRRTRLHGMWPLLGWTVFLALKSLPRFYGQSLLKQAAWGGVCLLGLLWLLQRESSRPGFIATPPVRALRSVGEISYSLYAVHTPAIMLATWTLLHAGQANYLAQLGLAMTFSLLATFLVYRGVELPSYRARAPARAALIRAVSPPVQS